MRYSAFISYNHRDVRWAKWLHSALERYRLPKQLIGRESPLGTLAASLPPVFRDREELGASGNLAASVQAALEQSSALIVICSPAAVASRWVNEEIRQYAASGRSHRIFCLIVDGEPHASTSPGGDPKFECFPPELIEVCSEPLAADARPGMDGKRDATLKLISGLLAVDYDSLRQRDAARRQRRMAWISAASVAGFLFASILAISAVISRNEAIEQRNLARQKTLTAERTVTFVKSLFEVTDPSEAKGATITAREILDRGAKQIEQDLKNEPNVKAELATTLGEVYSALGLYRDGQRLIEKTFGLPNLTASTRVRQSLAMADALNRQGDYHKAIDAYKAALRLSGSPGAERADLQPRILIGLGEAQSAVEDFANADRAIRNALALDVKALGRDHPDVARDLEALALNAFNANQLNIARSLYDRALAIRLRAQGPNHPRVSDDLNQLGFIAYLQRDSAAAERFYRRVLQSDAAVLGPNHPDFAATLNNLARLMLERQSFAEALPYLQRAVAINLRQRDETHDDLAFYFANLAIAQRGLGKTAEAESLFRRALVAAQKHKHRNLGPILVDIADLQCRRGDSGAGLASIDKAEPVIKADYPDDPWRMAWADNTRGACLLAAGRPDEARRLFDRSLPILRERWARGTLYLSMAEARAARLRDL